MSEVTVCDGCGDAIEFTYYRRSGRVADGEGAGRAKPPLRRRLARALLGPALKLYRRGDGRGRGGTWNRLDLCPRCQGRLEAVLADPSVLSGGG